MLTNVRFILVETSHPGNIGASARAMKTMGLNNLCLVNPKIFPHVDATARAAGADDLLAQADITSSLLESIKDCTLVFGTSARTRALPVPVLDPSHAAQKIIDECKQNKIAILFGRENNGLSNEELNHCHYHIHIPTNPKFSSLNIAAAVQIIAYELHKAQNTIFTQTVCTNTELATAEKMASFYTHMQQTLLDVEFIAENQPKNILSRLKLLFNRARPTKQELDILRGFFTAIQKKLNKHKMK
ncbi:MAG: RNA methyltransferase [Gammaproteobacteria bacterium]|nr:RNA methyltransferase [Gammaproteobacteria bacterium]